MQPEKIVTFTLLLFCSACAPLASHEHPAQMRAATTIASQATLGAQDMPADRATDEVWSLGDPQLAQLYALGLKNAPQYAQVLARVRKADALAGVQRAAGLPQVSADGSLNEAQTSRNLGLPSQFTGFLPKGLHSNSRIALSASLDADLFGRQRAAVAAALSEAAATRFDLAAAQQALIASIAEAYVDFAANVDEEAAAEATAALRQHQLDLATLRVKAGLDDESVTEKATIEARSAHEAVLDVQRQIDIARYRIAALIGEGPDFGLTLAAPNLAMPTVLVDQVGLDVIANRPDVAAARVRVEAQADRVKMARRDFYPNISLSALAGFQSFDAGQLLLGSSAIPGIGAAVHLPIFDSGRLKAAYRAQQADYDGAVAAYNATLVGAFQDIGASLARLKRAQAQVATAVANEANAERNDAIAKSRVRAKIVSEYSIMPIHQALLDAQARVADARSGLDFAQVDVLRALGGRVTKSISGEKQ